MNVQGIYNLSKKSNSKNSYMSHCCEPLQLSLVRNNFDFIKINGQAVKNTRMQRSPSLTALDDLKKKQEEEQKNYKKGSVPK